MIGRVNLVFGRVYLLSEKLYLVLEGASNMEGLTSRLSGESEHLVFGRVFVFVIRKGELGP